MLIGYLAANGWVEADTPPPTTRAAAIFTSTSIIRSIVGTLIVTLWISLACLHAVQSRGCETAEAL